MKELEEFNKDFGLLVETGFVAVKQGDEDSAVKLFRSAQLLRPNSVEPQIGFGYIALNKLELGEAEKTFEAVVAKAPTNYLGKTFLGLVMMLAKTDPERGEKLVNETIANCEDASIIEFANTCLKWKEEYFSKEAGNLHV